MIYTVSLQNVIKRTVFLVKPLTQHSLHIIKVKKSFIDK